MHHQPHEAAWPQGIAMYELKIGTTESGLPYAAGVGVSQQLISAASFAIKDSELAIEPGKADLLERRLARMERALGLDPICDR